jgi:hypothetical protein
VDLGLPSVKPKPAAESTGSNEETQSAGDSGTDGESGGGATAEETEGAGRTSADGDSAGSGASSNSDSSAGEKSQSTPIKDPRTVKRLLQEFKPKGAKREKVSTLVDEAQALTLNRTPLAFCFLLRSMFEVSAKAYCGDHEKAGGPKMEKSNGDDRKLVDVLRDITQHLTNNKKDIPKVKMLHGAMTELAKQDGLLSVTSMNQLVHNPTFSVLPGDVAVLFGNVFPLLRAMND